MEISGHGRGNSNVPWQSLVAETNAVIHDIVPARKFHNDVGHDCRTLAPSRHLCCESYSVCGS